MEDFDALEHYAARESLLKFQSRSGKVEDESIRFEFPWGKVVECRCGQSGLAWQIHVFLAARVESDRWVERFASAHQEFVDDEMNQVFHWHTDSIRFDDYSNGCDAEYSIATSSYAIADVARLWVAQRLLPELWPRVMFEVCGLPPIVWAGEARRRFEDLM